MRRIVVVTAALSALFGGAAAVRAADTPLVASPVAKMVGCDLGGIDRSAIFYGRMDAIPGAARMAMRFTLLERLGRDGTWQKLDVPALHTWHKSALGVKTFGYKQTVDNLRSGAAYKARIQYRWSGAAGDLLDLESRDTPVCRGPLPNLTTTGLDVQPGPTAETRAYRVSVSNDGHAGADSVDVVLIVDHAVLDTIDIAHLDPGETRAVTFNGPACNRTLRVKVDPSNTVGELVEGDNTRLYPCPA